MSENGISASTAQSIIEAMDRLKARNEALEKQVKILETQVEGHSQRIENLESAFEKAFKEAQTNFEQVVSKLLNDESESGEGGESGESDQAVEDTQAEVVGE